LRRTLRTSLTAALAGAGLMLTACGSPAASQEQADAGVSVVTSTNVYGDIVKAIGGDKVDVKAIITKSSQDPHSYEATAQDRLAISKADLVVENGGGYDDFIHKMADDSKISHDNVVSAVEVSGLAPEEAGGHSESTEGGHAHDHGEFNEHVWYSVPAMGRLADAVATKLGALAPGSSAEFTANATAYKSRLPTAPPASRLRNLSRCTCWKRRAWKTALRPNTRPPSKRAAMCPRQCCGPRPSWRLRRT
jgi:zinc/manganese transport system substrate-binding protein